MRVQLSIGETDVDPSRVDELEVVQTVDAESDRLGAVIGADGIAEIPPSGVRVEAWVNRAYLGGFVLSELGYRTGRRGASIQVLAAGADLAAVGLRTPATRARPDGLTLAALIAQIASAHNYEPRIHPDVHGIRLSHEDQITESDLQFVTRIADEHDVDLRFQAGFAVALPRTSVSTVAGLPLGRTIGDFTDLDVRISDRWDFQAVVARYYDYDQGRPVTVRLGNPTGPAYEVPGVQSDAGHAEAAAQRERTRLTERAWTLVGETPGDPGLIPHVELDVPRAALPAGAPLRWRLTEVVHRVDEGGFRTSFRGTVPERPPDRPEPPVESKVTYSPVRYRDPNRDYERLVNLE